MIETASLLTQPIIKLFLGANKPERVFTSGGFILTKRVVPFHTKVIWFYLDLEMNWNWIETSGGILHNGNWIFIFDHRRFSCHHIMNKKRRRDSNGISNRNCTIFMEFNIEWFQTTLCTRVLVTATKPMKKAPILLCTFLHQYLIFLIIPLHPPPFQRQSGTIFKKHQC